MSALDSVYVSQEDRGDSAIEESVEILTKSPLRTLGAVDGISLQRTDEARRALHQIQLRINSAYNAKLPINQASTPIIQRIFLFSVVSYHAHLRQAINISHTCRLWRNVALECPGLWVFIDLRHHHSATTLLKRAGTAPLYLEISDYDAYRPNTKLSFWNFKRNDWEVQMRLVPGVIRRVRSLALSVHVPEHWAEVSSCISEPDALLNLHALTIVMPPSEGERLPDYFLNPRVPLRALTLQRNVLDWGAMPIRNLTRISLTGPPVPPTVSQLMALCESSLNLEELELISFFTDARWKDESIDLPTYLEYTGRVLTLPRLWKIILFVETPTCASFYKRLLEHISTPSLRYLFVNHARSYSDSESEYSSLLDVHLGHFSFPFPTLRHARVTTGLIYTLQARTARACADRTIGDVSKTPSVVVESKGVDYDLQYRSFASSDSPATRAIILDDLHRLRGIQSLELDSLALEYVGQNSGIDILAAMPELRSLSLVGDQTRWMKSSEVLGVLLSRSTELPFTKLSLRCMEYSHDWVSKVVAMSRTRELHIVECFNVNASDVSELRASGVDVTWTAE